MKKMTEQNNHNKNKLSMLHKHWNRKEKWRNNRE